MSLAVTFHSHEKPHISRALLCRLKNAVLSEHYSLSVVFTNSAKMRRLSRAYRKIDKTADILSFPLSKTEGEIFISTVVARREAIKFGRPFENFLLFLLIHGFLHLMGCKHGKKMESLERVWRKKLKI